MYLQETSVCFINIKFRYTFITIINNSGVIVLLINNMRLTKT